MATYSFLNCQASIVGPGGAISVGNGSGAAPEGITLTMSSEKDTMNIGADGAVMHTLNADKSGTVTVRMLKVSPTNYLLSAMYNNQTISAALHGQNTLTVRDTARGDVITCRDVAFKRQPAVTYGKEGPVLEWEFNAGQVDMLLGIGTPTLV